MQYNLKLNKAIKEIKKQKAKLVCIQLPNGLKLKAKEIQEKIERNTKANVLIWLGSCFGVCDIPDLSKQKIDLLIQWGHNKFGRKY